MKNLFNFLLLFLCFSSLGISQGKFTIQNNKKSDKIKFELINNLIIIPVKVNDIELSFLLDTGVSKTIIFNYKNISDSLKMKDTEAIYLRGLGEGESVEALKSRNNVFKIGDAIKLNQDLFAIYNENINFAPRLGIPVHGIVGFDLFKDLVVEINYSNKYIRLTEPKEFHYKNCKKCETLNLEFYNNKPYLNANVKIAEKDISVKLLIDSGGSDALWLFEDKNLGIRHSDKYFEDFLGHGLSGSVYGKRSKIDEISFKGFKIKDANVAFPDSSSIAFAKQFKDRNGSLAGNILKRFNLIVDYQKASIVLKKNVFFKQEFTYNKSGIELAHHGVRFVKEADYKNNQKIDMVNEETNSIPVINWGSSYKLTLKPAYAIVELREDSPAFNAGLKIGDIILSINGKSTYEFTLQDLMQKFYDKEGSRIKLNIERNGTNFIVNFRLENLLE
ncbi:aspartyl protease family protein [Gaetbulibacter aquiaggeris]|uniref:Aspartyl protease family protein n=1 Tax=Gaetbulibacter aquiaggeris TaxID=1735373 RepID=A0ABW7MMI7_9FLAO